MRNGFFRYDQKHFYCCHIYYIDVHKSYSSIRRVLLPRIDVIRNLFKLHLKICFMRNNILDDNSLLAIFYTKPSLRHHKGCPQQMCFYCTNCVISETGQTFSLIVRDFSRTTYAVKSTHAQLHCIDSFYLYYVYMHLTPMFRS